MVVVLNEKDRIFGAWGAVEIRDDEGELIPMEELDPIMPIMMKRGGNIIDGHSNLVVGKILNYAFKMKETKEGPKPGIYLINKIYDDYPTDDEVWENIKEGRATGMSFGGKASKDLSKFEYRDGMPVKVLRGLQGFEFTVVRPGRKPANPEATIVEANMVAKSMNENNNHTNLDEYYVEICNVGVCIPCDKELSVLKDIEITKADGDKFKEGDGVMYGPLDDDHFRKAIVLEDIDEGTVKIKLDDGEILETDKDNVNFPDKLNFEIIKDIIVNKRVEKRGDKWCVVHCHGPEAGEVIACHDSKEAAERQHRAIQANKDVNKMPEDGRPPKKWFEDCVAGVKRSGGAEDPEAVCGNLWHNVMKDYEIKLKSTDGDNNSMAENNNKKENKKEDKKEDVKKQEEPAAAPNGLAEINAKLDRLIELLTPAEAPAAEVQMDAATKAMPGDKKEGAPEGTVPKGSGAGNVMLPPKDIVEETQNKEPSTTAPETVKLEKEMTDLKKDVGEMKEVMKSIKVTKSMTGRPDMKPEAKKEEKSEALEIAKGGKPVGHGFNLTPAHTEDDRKATLKALGRDQ